ncbi:MAG: YraN family protein [Pseudoxanthomonas sp.]
MAADFPHRTAKRARGDVAEAAALRHLLAAGLRQVATNANYRSGELDLVMQDGGTLVFVEVRYRRSQGFGGGFASVDLSKRRKIIRAAQLFLLGHRQYANAPCRFDVVEAGGDADAPTIEWMKDAFRADDA